MNNKYILYINIKDIGYIVILLYSFKVKIIGYSLYKDIGFVPASLVKEVRDLVSLAN